MPKATLRIPQIGEGLQEARLVAVLKQPGEAVKRDEPIYQMETDKAVMDVESPYEGTLVEWMANVDDVLPIGAEVGLMETEDEVEEEAGHGHAPAAEASEAVAAEIPATASASGERRRDVPPRTRAYAKQKGLSDDDLANVPASGSRLMPEDIDAYLASSGGNSEGTTSTGAKYTEEAMSQKQRILSSRLVRGNQMVVPGTMTVSMNWEPIEQLRQDFKDKGGDFQPSTFTIFSYAAARAVKDFPMFRSTITGDNIRTYEHIQLGIAVSLPGDELVLAVVDDADSLSWSDFAMQMRDKIDLAREGRDQANEAVTLNLTNMQAHGIRDAVAVVVPPGVATLFLGETYWGLDQNASTPTMQRQANLGITFDHRLINGVGAALFQNAVKANVENIRDLVSV